GGLEQARTMIFCISKNGFLSDWTALEHQTALFRDPTNSQRRFIPLRLDDSAIPAELKQFAYIDWRGNSSWEFDRLVAICRGQSSISEQRSNVSDRMGYTDAKGVVIDLDPSGLSSSNVSEIATLHDAESRRRFVQSNPFLVQDI